MAPSPAATFPCWHCGEKIQSLSQAILPGDVVLIRDQPAPTEQRLNSTLDRGDLVAFPRDGILRLKRLVGLPGDQIDLRNDHLIVNSTRIEDLLGKKAPSVLVDDDARRPQSRWRWHTDLPEPDVPAESLSPAELVSPAPARSDEFHLNIPLAQQINQPAWLAYHHESVYEHNRRGPIRDDYPGNVGLSRTLHPVDRLIVSIELTWTSDLASDGEAIETLFWTESGPRTLAQPIHESTRSFTLDARDAIGSTSSFPSHQQGLNLLTAETPVAIRLPRSVTIDRLTIRRLVEYRVNKTDDRSRYPLTLGISECFVLGDNVPVSIDSRQWGAVPVDSITGIVETSTRE